ncbi:MAG: hypothetical protein HYR55_18465 [Acidobacteria bacterium]|nr:hypothetical protein [Acidobacteriota bacterium]MBI3655139.1 hypothetical protein [Acidobacteriota bacterium]
MNGYTLDTNIITALLKRNAAVIQKVEATLQVGYPVVFNAISYYEIKRGLLAAGMRRQLA